MDKISRKQRQIERKVENLKRFGAEEDKYKSSPHIRPVTKTTLKTSTNGISSSENGSSSSSKTSSRTDESLKNTENGSSASSKPEKSLNKSEEEKASETIKPKTKIIKKKIIKKPATAASNGTEKIEEKSELTKSTTSNQKQSDNNHNKVENVPRTYQIVITLSDYLADEEEGDEDEPFGLDEGQCVEVLDNANPDAWLLRTKTKPPSIGFVPGSYFASPTKYYALQREACSVAKLLKTEEEFIEELKLALDYYGKGLSEDNEDSETSEVPQTVKERSKELLVSNLVSIYDFHSKWDF
uniref:SH3 domain-containing protein n=1 Tax=Meloidogyne javanica TaxID=6303 RepID=A0A915LNV0_MELJA